MKIKLVLVCIGDPKKPVAATFDAPIDIKAIVKTAELFGTCRATMHVDLRHETMIFPDIGTMWSGVNVSERKEYLVKTWIDKLILQTITRELYR